MLIYLSKALVGSHARSHILLKNMSYCFKQKSYYFLSKLTEPLKTQHINKPTDTRLLLHTLHNIIQKIAKQKNRKNNSLNFYANAKSGFWNFIGPTNKSVAKIVQNVNENWIEVKLPYVATKVEFNKEWHNFV